MHSKANILLLYTGGTIGMMKDFETGALKAFNFKKLLQRIPELKQLDCTIETLSFEKPIDSSNMNLQRWVERAEVIGQKYEEFDGFFECSNCGKRISEEDGTINGNYIFCSGTCYYAFVI